MDTRHVISFISLKKRTVPYESPVGKVSVLIIFLVAVWPSCVNDF